MVINYSVRGNQHPPPLSHTDARAQRQSQSHRHTRPTLPLPVQGCFRNVPLTQKVRQWYLLPSTLSFRENCPQCHGQCGVHKTAQHPSGSLAHPRPRHTLASTVHHGSCSASVGAGSPAMHTSRPAVLTSWESVRVRKRRRGGESSKHRGAS